MSPHYPDARVGASINICGTQQPAFDGGLSGDEPLGPPEETYAAFGTIDSGASTRADLLAVGH